MQTSSSSDNSKAKPSHHQLGLSIETTSHKKPILKARLDTCVDVNLMPASVYKLLFQDPNMKKFAPSSLEVGTYTSDNLKIVVSCMFCLVYLDTKKPMEVTFYVAMNNGSVLLSCKTTLMLGLKQPGTRLESPAKSKLNNKLS